MPIGNGSESISHDAFPFYFLKCIIFDFEFIYQVIEFSLKYSFSIVYG